MEAVTQGTFIIMDGMYRMRQPLLEIEKDNIKLREHS
jgi:hypothetical protein